MNSTCCHSKSKPNDKILQINEDENNEIRETFKYFDSDRDEKLDYHELKVAFRALGIDIQRLDVLKLIRNYDQQGKNKISYRDFHAIASEMILQRDSHEEILKAFKHIDADQSGKISLINLRHISRELGDNVSEQELKAMIDDFDLDGDGEISFDEFLAMLKSI